MNTQQYHAEDTAEPTFGFVHGDRIGEVVATFVRADDPTHKLQLSGRPEEQVSSGRAGYTYRGVVISGRVTVDDRLGEYRLGAVEAVYPGGRGVPFGDASEAGIQRAEEEIASSEIYSDSWEWGKGFTDGGGAT